MIDNSAYITILRKKIDNLNLELLQMLNKRLSLTAAILKIKNSMGEDFHDPVREKEMLERLLNENKGPLKKEDLEKIFSLIFKTALDYTEKEESSS